jgi:hypothetical protein
MSALLLLGIRNARRWPGRDHHPQSNQNPAPVSQVNPAPQEEKPPTCPPAHVPTFQRSSLPTGDPTCPLT